MLIDRYKVKFDELKAIKNHETHRKSTPDRTNNRQHNWCDRIRKGYD
jgi:hypothetical protein